MYIYIYKYELTDKLLVKISVVYELTCSRGHG